MALSSMAELAIVIEAHTLPKGLFFYEVAGQSVFPCYSAGGGFSMRAVAFLIQRLPSDAVDFGSEGLHEEAGGRWFSLVFEHGEDHDIAGLKIAAAVGYLLSGKPDRRLAWKLEARKFWAALKRFAGETWRLALNG